MDSIGGFVPLAVGNAWKYSFSQSWSTPHSVDGSGESDSGFRRITIISRGDSAGVNLIHARIEDSGISRMSAYGYQVGEPRLIHTDRMLSILEDSSRLWLVPGTMDDDGMAAAFFSSHAFPADSAGKIPSTGYEVAGLPDSMWVVFESSATWGGGGGQSWQARGIRTPPLYGCKQESKNPDGSDGPEGWVQFSLLEFPHSV